MSKALTKAQADLDALAKQLEAWIASQPAKPVQRTRKPAVKRTPAPVPTASTVEDVDTSWLDLLDPVAVTEPVVTPAPLYTDATDLIRIELNPPHILDFPEPQPEPARRTLRQAWRDGYDSYGK